MGSPRLLLLDEPTSEMDPRSEALVVDNLRRGLDNRTLIVVTHKPAVLELVDRLIVIENGRILADGPKAQVLDQLRQSVANQPKNTSAPAAAVPLSHVLKGAR